ncbi:histidine triad (HIT) family protein [Caminicella sporogenes DSM 14501]|uniref:Histidine triad (HIT) family protein n=1 Tax=Caminicella sporogenes DSM 14501 TaxID=1121266 RepID=A0A1M6MC09_9FIRM|nr:histidine triad nucleotide-binding protein [Caminicella sporogenes]RKD27610.1 histidine triad nucleotide-binding protein [Caminicella sporogenes]WIF94803.1 histidine triad nucleotide-binding protein [Caminicella sporogenes]SHJ81011.1 histidine triad (HIT) family protein [Caminicella sporogenes DSM 14501]
MSECVFCKIVNKEIPSEIVYEDDKIIAFKDINPIAPVHVLFIPKNHIASLNDIDNENADVISHIFIKIREMVKELGISDEGYRVVSNCGALGGQTVDHIHFHLIGGRQFQWPPG